MGVDCYVHTSIRVMLWHCKVKTLHFGLGKGVVCVAQFHAHPTLLYPGIDPLISYIMRVISTIEVSGVHHLSSIMW